MIFNWLFKRFKKSKNKEAVAPVFVDVPTREDLIKNNQNEMIELLDQYKKEYKEKLKGKLLFNDISCENLSKKYLENQDIIIKHIMSDNYTGINEILAKGDIKELLEAKLEYLKLYILSEENNRLHNEMLLRYMALTEIKKKAYFIRPTERRAISNELDFLYSGLIICKSNNFATNADCKLYLIRMNEINRYMNNLSNEENELLNNRKKLVTKLACTFIKDKYNEVLSSNMHDLGIISYLEIELEKYYLSHKEDFELCKLEILPKQNSDKEDAKQLLKQVEDLEAKYLLLNMFNKLSEDMLLKLYEAKFNILTKDINCLISKDMFLKLYEAKFNILTKDINCFGVPVISKEDYGYEYYKKIVGKKINLLLRDNDIFACQNRFNVIKDYFINADETLNDIEKLSILLLFDKENGFKDLLNNTLIKKNDLKTISLFSKAISLNNDNNYLSYYESIFNDVNSYGIEWSEYISLRSILEIIWRKEYPNESSLIHLYRLSNLAYSSNQLPDGIIKFAPTDSDKDWQDILGSLSIEIKLPRTIKEFDGSDIGAYYVTELPYGIEKIVFNTYQDIPPIPPTVNEIKLCPRLNDKCVVLTFLDFKYSRFLRKKTDFLRLVETLHYYNIPIKFRLENVGEIREFLLDNINDLCIIFNEPGDLWTVEYDCYVKEKYYEEIARKLNYGIDKNQTENKQKIKEKNIKTVFVE